MPLAKCSFGMIPLSRHSVDRPPRSFHSSTHNVVRASCFEVLSASVESRKLFLDGSLCLGTALAMEWVSRVIFLEPVICVAGNISAYVGGGAIPARAYKQGIGVAFKQPVIIIHLRQRHTSKQNTQTGRDTARDDSCLAVQS